MFNVQLKPVAPALGNSVGKRAALGSVFGIWLLAAPAFAASSSLGSSSSELIFQ